MVSLQNLLYRNRSNKTCFFIRYIKALPISIHSMNSKYLMYMLSIVTIKICKVLNHRNELQLLPCVINYSHENILRIDDSFHGTGLNLTRNLAYNYTGSPKVPPLLL